jgi:hypothetical protein
MRKAIYLFSFYCLLLSQWAWSQITYHFGAGIGGSPYSDYSVAKTINGGIGYTFFEELTFHGGLNLFSQDSYLFKFELGEEEEWRGEGKESFTSLLLQGGISYSLTLKTFTKDRDPWDYKRIGIYPEIRGYYNPWVYREFETEGGEKIKAPYSTQFAHGIGGGILYGSWKIFVVLKYECNNIDNLESIGKLVEDLEKGGKYNHVVSLAFVFR